MSLTRNLRSHADRREPAFHSEANQRQLFGKLDELETVKAAVRQITQPAEYTEIETKCRRIYAERHPGPLCSFVSYAFERDFFVRQLETLRLEQLQRNEEPIDATPLGGW